MIDTPPAAWTQQGDPNWGAFYASQKGNHSHWIKGQTATYTVLDETRDWDSTRYYDLLNKKIAEAEASLKAELHQQLYGRKPESNPLRQAIADAYDQVTHEATISRTLSTYKDQISAQIFSESPILRALKQEKEKDMTNTEIAYEAVAKRKEKRAKRAADFVGEYIETTDWVDGDMVAWTVDFPSSDKTYHYVAVRGGANWFITGDSTKYSNDALIGKIVTLSLDGKVVLGEDEL